MNKILSCLFIIFFSFTHCQLFAKGENMSNHQVATLAGGCFWCMQPPYDKTDGVIKTVVGYAGGGEKSPSYEQVASGQTGHIESIQITYDADKLSYEDIIKIFWRNIDPFDASGQFCDKGKQYRSAIFFHDEKQKEIAESTKHKIEKDKEKSVATEILAFSTFYPAEEYHQSFYIKSSIRYKFYRYSCGRDKRLEAIWGK